MALGSFSYGPHPSIIMWKAAETSKEEDKDKSILQSVSDAVEGVRTQVESVFSSTPDSSQFSSFKFDAIVSEGHEARTEVTKVPVSSGMLVSDHIINGNRILKLKAVASNMQNSAMWTASVQGLSVLTGAIFNNPVFSAVGGIVGAVSSAFETEDRIQSTYELFNSLRTSGTKLYISTIASTYLNCVVTSIRTVTDKDNASILSVEITFEELQVIGGDSLADAAKKSIESSYDYSGFAKVAQSVGIGVLGGAPLPGLGSVGLPTSQLKVLKNKLAKLPTNLSSVKGVLA